MYQSHWGLADTPFRGRPDPQFFHQSPTHGEALARVHFLVDDHRRLGLLLGAQGSGKSLLLDVFAQQARQMGWPVAQVNLMGVQPCELLWQMASQFGLSPEPGLQLDRLWPMLCDRIREYRYQELPSVVLLDDVDESGEGTALQIARLVQTDPDPQSRMTIVLASRPDRVACLGEGLLDRVELRIDLEPWGPEETADYLRSTLAKAGRRTPLFADPAVARLHTLACGVPRRVSQLADLALLAGAGRDLDRIDADTVEAVYHELGAIEV